MERPLKEAMCNLFTISAIQVIVSFATHLLMIKPSSTMDLAQKIVLSSNTSPPTYNSLESFAIRTELFMSVVLVTENAWLIDATVS